MSKNLKNNSISQKFKLESQLVRENSMKVLKEFEVIDMISNDLPDESKKNYWILNKYKFIKQTKK